MCSGSRTGKPRPTHPPTPTLSIAIIRNLQIRALSIALCSAHRVEVDTGYNVVVTELSSSVSGTSESFEVLPAQSTSSSSIDRSADFQEIGGGGGAVEDMNIALVIVATICGECAEQERCTLFKKSCTSAGFCFFYGPTVGVA